jgi:starch phosphorylase
MSTFACNTCQEINGVSKLHGWTSQKMFAPIWKGYYPEENHVGYVTNGVHFPTWCASEWRKLYDAYFDPTFMNDQSNEELWHAIYHVDDAEIWQTRMALKKKLVDYIREKFTQTWLKNQGDPARVVSLLERINPNALMIGFCRRFATYKRANLLFTDLDRLSKIVNDPEHPVLFFFSGKAHPADGAGQGLIKMIFEISQRPEFLGKIIFLENYDMQLAHRLVSGCDIWMNTPTRPLEASGTSGEKAEMNGVVNLSVLDGWWVEGYRKGAGWALPQKRTYQNQAYQDKLDAATIYNLLENEIVPLYYDQGKDGYSHNWVSVIKNSIATIAPHYTMKRQLDDYYNKFYIKEAERFKKLSANDNRLAKEIALWKEEVAQRWDSIKVVSKDTSVLSNGGETGMKYRLTYTVDEQGLNDAIGLELVTLKPVSSDDERQVYKVYPFKLKGHEGNNYTYEAVIEPEESGTFRSCVRMYPKNPNLPHRQDFCYVKWLS